MTKSLDEFTTMLCLWLYMRLSIMGLVWSAAFVRQSVLYHKSRTRGSGLSIVME